MRTGTKAIYVSYAVLGDPFKVVAKFKCYTAAEAERVQSQNAALYPAKKYRMTKEAYKY